MCEVAVDRLVAMLAETLERMAFVTVFPCERISVPADPLLVTVDFAGPAQGRIELLASKGLGVLMAANVLASDPDDPQAEQQAHDALRELLNVTCGAMLSEWTGEMAGMFRMGIPEVRLIDEAQWHQALASGGFTALDADSQVVAVRLLGSESE